MGDRAAIGGIDIGGTKVAVTVATPDAILCRLTLPTIKTGSDDALPMQVVELLQAACDKAGVPRVAAVGVSSAGPFSLRDGKLALVTPNICGANAQADDLPNDWDSIPLQAVLERHFRQVVICNDAVAALNAERHFGAVQGEANCVYVTWSTGVGFGLCVDGNLLGGKHGNAGHAGHMLMSETSKARCGCGNIGDLEALISGRNLARRLGRSTADVFNAARQGNAGAYEVAMEAAKWLGRGLYNVTAVLDTRKIVIGGSVWEHHHDWLAPVVEQELGSRFPALTAGVQLLSAALGSAVADVGALSLVMPPQWQPAWRARRPWEALMTHEDLPQAPPFGGLPAREQEQ